MFNPALPDSLTRATWSLTYATWGLVAAAFIGMIFTYWQLNQERHWRRGENLARLRELFDGEVFTRVRRTLAQQRLKQMQPGADPLTYETIPATGWRMLDLCEAICSEVDAGRLDLEDVWSEFSEWITVYSTDLSFAIQEERRQRKDDTYYSSIESVRGQLDKYCAKRGVVPLRCNDGDIRGFYETELESCEAP